jgi:hypothetical protein
MQLTWIQRNFSKRVSRTEFLQFAAEYVGTQFDLALTHVVHDLKAVGIKGVDGVLQAGDAGVR